MSSNNGSSPPLQTRLRTRGFKYETVLRCPLTQSPLRLDGDVLVSVDDPNQRYHFETGLLQLCQPQLCTELETISAERRIKLQNKGWAAPDIESFRRLPQTGIPGWPLGYWQRRASGTAELWRIIEAARREADQLPIGPMGIALDLSDGMGWLGYGLDASGYITVVVSEDAGSDYGLGVFPYSRYLRVQASITNPPLSPQAFDLVVFSYSLESCASPQEALENASRLVKPAGHLIVMSDRTDEQATSVNAHQTETTLRKLGLNAWQQRIGAMGSRWSRTMKNLLGQAPDMPPMVIGRRPKP
ncbi:MAG: class I SAM-dependent methyltransferase [Chloroflexi bacterium]|nr:class I SAM-dependent methyltransferase [Chloroflexota bacterium]